MNTLFTFHWIYIFSSKFDILTFAICCYNLRQWKNVNKSSPSILQHNQHDDILPNHVCYKIMQHNILLNLQTLNFVCLLLQYIFFHFFSFYCVSNGENKKFFTYIYQVVIPSSIINFQVLTLKADEFQKNCFNLMQVKRLKFYIICLRTLRHS